MIRALGAALIVCGAAGAGVRAYLALGAGLRQLAGYASMLEILRCEIFPGLATIENALEAAKSAGFAAGFAARVLAGIRKHGGAEAGRCWLEACRDAPAELRDALAELAPVLGRYSAEEQSAAIARVERKLASLRERAEEERRRSGRMYITFGVCGGIAAAVMLL